MTDLTLEELKSKAEDLYAKIERCAEEDQEWTSPRGNGTNPFEASEAALAFIELIRRTR